MKVILENFISLSVLQVVNLILPFVTLPYIIHIVGFDLYGVIVLASSLSLYFQSLTDYSFVITATRDVAIFRDSSKKLNLIYSRVMFVKFFFLFCSCLLISILILCVPKFKEHSLVFFLTMPMLLGYALFPEWFFQGMEKMKYIAFLNISIKIFFTVFVFILIKHPEDYWIYPLLQGCGYIGAALVGQWIMVRKYNLKLVYIKYKIFKNTIIQNFPVFVNQFMPTLFNNTTIFLMGLIINTHVIGVFDAIKRIITIESVFIQIVSKTFFPFLNSNKNMFDLFAKYSLLALSAMIVGVLLLHPFIFRLLLIDDKNAFFILLLLSIGIFFFGVYQVFSMNYLIIHRYDKLVMRITIISSLVGFFSAYPLVKFFGVLGGTVNIMMCQVLIGGLAYINYKIIIIKNHYAK